MRRKLSRHEDRPDCYSNPNNNERRERISVFPNLSHLKHDEKCGYGLFHSEKRIRFAGEEGKTLRGFLRPIKAVRETDKAFDIFEQLLETRAHIAIVTDKYGGLEGLVTLEDAHGTRLLHLLDADGKPLQRVWSPGFAEGLVAPGFLN